MTTVQSSPTEPVADVRAEEPGGAEEPVGNLLPIVFIGDRSTSMSGAPIDTVNRELQAMATGLLHHPIAGAVTRFAVVSFADDATVDLEPSEVKDVHERLPRLVANGRTSLATGLDLVHDRLPAWCEAMRRPADGRVVAVARPTVFVFTDGAPTDPEAVWRAALSRFTDLSNKWRPNVVAFGVGQADPRVIAALPQGHGAAFMADRGDTVSTCLSAIVAAVLKSVVQTATMGVTPVAGAGGQLTVPPPIPTAVPGMTALPLTVGT